MKTKTTKEQNFASAVLFVAKKDQVFDEFLSKILAGLRENFERFEVILVQGAGAKIPSDHFRSFLQNGEDSVLSIVRMGISQSLESAMSAGTEAAIGDFVFEFDMPRTQFDFQLAMAAYQRVLENHDIVAGCPNGRTSLTSKIFYRLVKQNSANQIELKSEEFRVLSRRAINRIKNLNEMIPYRKAVYYNCGLRRSQVDYALPAGVVWARKDSFMQRWELGSMALLLFTDIGARMATLMSIVMFFFSTAVIGYTVYVYLRFQRVVEGWTTTMLFLSVAFSGLFLLLGVLIRYAVLHLSLLSRKQNYIVESMEKVHS